MSVRTLSEAQIYLRYLKQYDKDPSNYRFFYGISPSGNPEFLINHPKRSWLIKRDSRYTGMPGIGMEVDYVKLDLPMEQTGLRPIDRHAMDKMMGLMGEGAGQNEIKRVIDSIMSQEPVSFDALRRARPVGIAMGTPLVSRRPIQSIVNGQIELDAILEKEIQRLKGNRTRNIM